MPEVFARPEQTTQATAVPTASLYNITAMRDGGDTVLKERSPYCAPLDMATIKLERLYALLMLFTQSDGDALNDLNESDRKALVFLATDLALEAQVLVSLAHEVRHG
ncbi:hypothetical protein [Ralstonia pseudosolanacearum]|uniref:Uncharacterized protein n=1 Tax=Ralstonia nicotianae (strain ATCC BAA-1114 / GMI1000) TaxID=267608 RepID=Q8XWI9_RALN1|nr:hypothetical protein [Ralstonia pseudosolanacearum]AST28002.1 hypothetical protein CDC45_12645 [Ralstonia pseudosolanacearum]MCQ4681766.1 hypothetical protein [Ralstonia pseudosolanacearum]MDC6284102.1 hypothetical protein [Ralstonia pseudosolanacearum]CAD16192.1 hypothetical protein RSc2485 [Ralstonia pseudosolanacearum GMI1000]